jgi:hypothetical protein
MDRKSEINVQLVCIYKKSEGKWGRIRGIVCSLSETMSTTLTKHGHMLIRGIDGDGCMGSMDQDN